MSTNYLNRLINKALYQNGSLQDANKFFQAGNLKSEQNDFKGAIEDYTNALKISPNDAYAYLYRAKARFKIEDFQGTIDDYTLAMKYEPNEFDFANEIEIVKGKLYEQKINSFYINEKARMNPEAVAHFNKAMNLNINDNGIIAEFSKAIAINPNYSMAYIHRARIKSVKKDFHGALLDYNIAIKIFSDPHVIYKRGYLSVKIQEYRGAINDFNMVINYYTGTQKVKLSLYSLYSRGYSKFKLNDFIEALKDLDTALKLDDHEEYRQQGREGYDFGDFEKTDGYNSGTYALDLRNRISDLIKLDSRINADLSFDGATDPEYFYESYSLKRSLGDIHGANRDLDKALELGLDDKGSLDLASRFKVSIQDFQGAIKCYTKILELCKFHWSVYPYLGGIKLKMQDYQGAIKDFDIYIQHKTDEGHAFYKRGFCKIQLGQMKGGNEDILRAKELGYDDDDFKNDDL